jgi:anthranilate phosphoribosyltransferase
MDLARARDRIADPAGLSADEAVAVLDLLLGGGLAPAEGGALLAAWSARGETAVELATVAGVLRQRAVRVPWDGPAMDVCGTGGSGLDRFNISTAAAFVLAEAGVTVAKHGNRGSRRPDGSFDLLEALGIPFGHTPEVAARLLNETGLCFLFARAHHPAVKAAVSYRQAAGGRTIFNLAGPLANPLGVARQVVGVARPETAAVVAGALEHLGVERALVLCGHPGLDELSLSGPTELWCVAHGQPTGRRRLEPPQPRPVTEQAAGTATENAPICEALLQGAGPAPLREQLLRSAGLSLDLWHGRSPAWDGPGSATIAAILDKGAAWQRFERYRALARRWA